jgi:large subunit ribosomal protein L30
MNKISKPNHTRHTVKKPKVKTEKKAGKLNIKWVVSFIGCPKPMRQTIRGLGFRRMQQVLEVEDTPSIRGMIARVHHLVRIEE